MTVVHELREIEQCSAGPDAYRDLPRLLADVDAGASSAMNVQLSMEETYADVAPVRPPGSHSAFVSITRGARRSAPLSECKHKLDSIACRGCHEVVCCIGSKVINDKPCFYNNVDTVSSVCTSNSRGRVCRVQQHVLVLHRALYQVRTSVLRDCVDIADPSHRVDTSL